MEEPVQLPVKKNDYGYSGDHRQGLKHYKNIKGIENQLNWINENKKVIVQRLVRISPSFLTGFLFLSIFFNFFIIWTFSPQAKKDSVHRYSIGDQREARCQLQRS